MHHSSSGKPDGKTGRGSVRFKHRCAGIFQTIRDYRKVRAQRSHAAQVRIVHVYKCLVGSTLKIIIEFSLCTFHTFERAETRQMRLADIGYKPVIGQGYACQRGYFAGCARPHLYYGHIVPGRKPQQGKRHAYVVIEISLGGKHFVPGRKHGAYEFLCRGLAVRSRKRQNRKSAGAPVRHRQGGPVITGKILKGRQCVVHGYAPCII